MKGKLSSHKPTEVGPDYPKDLAREVRNLIVLMMGRVQRGDHETFRKFLAVVFELERVFDMFD